MQNWAAELAHLAVHAAHIGFGDPRAIFFGEIADWDPKTHCARAIIPVFVTVDPTTAVTSDPAQTPWFPYMTLGIGCQWAPKIGDLCIVIMTERATDAGIVLGIAHSDVHMPPIQFDPPLAQGEFAFVQRDSKSYVLLRQDGRILVQAKQQGDAPSQTAGPFITITPQGDTIIQGGPSGATYEMFYNGAVTIVGPESGSGTAVYTMDTLGQVTIQSAGGAQITLDRLGNIIFSAPNGDILFNTNAFVSSLNQFIEDYNVHTHLYNPGSGSSTPTAPPDEIVP